MAHHCHGPGRPQTGNSRGNATPHVTGQKLFVQSGTRATVEGSRQCSIQYMLLVRIDAVRFTSIDIINIILILFMFCKSWETLQQSFGLILTSTDQLQLDPA